MFVGGKVDFGIVTRIRCVTYKREGLEMRLSSVCAANRDVSIKTTKLNEPLEDLHHDPSPDVFTSIFL